MEAELEEAEWVRARYEQFNLIEERRLRLKKDGWRGGILCDL